MTKDNPTDELTSDAEAFGLSVGSSTIADLDGNELDLSYLEIGSGPLALCLHGYPDSPWTWRHLLPDLANAGFRAVAPFSRGYAPSSIPGDGCYQAGVLGVDANALHQSLEASDDAVIIGHDWGAMGTYAAVTLEPDRWRRAVAASVMPGPTAAEAFFDYDQLRRSWYMFFQLSDMADMFIPLDDFEYISRLWADWSPGFEATADVRRFRRCMAAPENLVAALSYYRHTLTPTLQDPRLESAQAACFAVPPVPLLYLHGENDGCMSPDLARTVGNHLDGSHSRAVMVPGTGHFLQLEEPAVVNDEILRFLAE